MNRLFILGKDFLVLQRRQHVLKLAVVIAVRKKCKEALVALKRLSREDHL